MLSILRVFFLTTKAMNISYFLSASESECCLALCTGQGLKATNTVTAAGRGRGPQRTCWKTHRGVRSFLWEGGFDVFFWRIKGSWIAVSAQVLHRVQGQRSVGRGRGESGLLRAPACLTLTHSDPAHCITFIALSVLINTYFCLKKLK